MQHNTVNKKEKKKGTILIKSREVFTRLLDVVLDPEENGRLPLVQLAQLVVLEELVGESFLVARFDGLDEVDEKLVLSR